MLNKLIPRKTGLFSDFYVNSYTEVLDRLFHERYERGKSLHAKYGDDLQNAPIEYVVGATMVGCANSPKDILEKIFGISIIGYVGVKKRRLIKDVQERYKRNISAETLSEIERKGFIKSIDDIVFPTPELLYEIGIYPHVAKETYDKGLPSHLGVPLKEFLDS